MIKLLLFCCILSGTILSVAAQEQPVRYRNSVFTKYTVQRNLSYVDSVTNGRKKRYYHFDLYQPAQDQNRKRPLIIWIHGGGFKFGTKRSAGTPVWSRTFARRGYVCVAMNYRLSRKRPLTRYKDNVAGCLDAVEDVLLVVKYFKRYHVKYGIDTSRIVLAGNSAGAIAALQAVYSSCYDMAKLSGKEGEELDTLSHVYNPANIKAVVSCWGAVYDTTWLTNTRVPIVAVHGMRDKIVPFDHKILAMYGSLAIERRADSLHIPFSLKAYKGYGHELHRHFNPFWASRKVKKRWLESGQFIADFLYKQLY